MLTTSQTNNREDATSRQYRSLASKQAAMGKRVSKMKRLEAELEQHKVSQALIHTHNLLTATHTHSHAHTHRWVGPSWTQTYSLTHPLTHSFTHASLIHLLTHCQLTVTHTFIHALTVTYTCTYSLEKTSQHTAIQTRGQQCSRRETCIGDSFTGSAIRLGRFQEKVLCDLCD